MTTEHVGLAQGKLVSEWARIGGLRIHTRRSVASPTDNLLPIVCVHGLSVSSRYMVPIAERLAPYRQVYAPDLPGFGRSQKPHSILDVPQLAHALAHWMAHYRIERAVMLGNSMGCQVIADLALRCPARVSQAVLVGPTADKHGRTMLEHARRLLIDGLHEPLASLLTQGRDYLTCGPRRTLVTLHHLLRDHIEAKLPHMRVPTLVVRGENDTIVPQAWVEELTRLLPNARLVLLPDAPHAANYSAPTQLARVVLDFLAESDNNSPYS